MMDMEFYERSKQRLSSSYIKLVRSVENAKLRLNDSLKIFGEQKYAALTAAREEVLENYRDDKIYEYYYSDIKGFCSFERWKLMEEYKRNA